MKLVLLCAFERLVTSLQVRCFASNFRVLARMPPGCVRRPKVFPFLPVLLPAKKRAVLPQTEILLIFLFSTPCSGYFDNRSAGYALGLTPCFSSILGANRAPNRRKNMVLACTASPALHS